jgi:hypothetical protein
MKFRVAPRLQITWPGDDFRAFQRLLPIVPAAASTSS